jgi:hypothetical protein
MQKGATVLSSAQLDFTSRVNGRSYRVKVASRLPLRRAIQCSTSWTATPSSAASLTRHVFVAQ